MRTPARMIAPVSSRISGRLPFQPHIISTFRTRPQPATSSSIPRSARTFISSPRIWKDDYAEKAKELNQKGQDDQEDGFNKQIDNAIGEAEELQARTPWHREGSDRPPVKRPRSPGAMTKGKLLTTPSRLLKLILPLTTIDKNTDRKSIEPLALLVHPQQPLSYLERLIQSELPLIKSEDGKDKVPQVHFRAEDSAQDEIKADTRDEELENEEEEDGEDTPSNTAISKSEDGEKKEIKSEKKEKEEGTDAQMIDGKLVKLGKISPSSESSAEQKSDAESGRQVTSSPKISDLGKHDLERHMRGGPGEGGVESYSGLGHSSPSPPTSSAKFVRWSSSTEIGDFIRDAARGKEFAVEIEGASREIRVGVPSFNDRTHYLRVRLRKTSRKLADLASVKKECDELAHKSAQRLAMGGMAVLVGWWGAIYHFTFQTDYGWDTMEPITYLVGLSTIMLGYIWFLYHNREVSYRAALNLTVSRRQNTLYTARGFDLQKWEALIEEANALRREVKQVAEEYDVEWDERQDEGSEEVHDALREERRKGKKGDKEEDGEDGDGRKEEKKDTKGKKKKGDD